MFVLSWYAKYGGYILGLSLISKGMDISWLFQGLEDFRRITARNTTGKGFRSYFYLPICENTW